jgi:histidinol dehydrogenase
MKKESFISKEVSEIIQRVALKGDRALEFYVRKFDKINLPSSKFLVTKKEIKEAYGRISPLIKSALLESKKRITFFHKKELEGIRKSWSVNFDGINVGQIVSTLERVGIYVPGGRTCYPSTVLMTAIPAKVAGVKQVVMVTPPKNLRDEVLAAAYIAGVDFVYRIGGPASIAALAVGTRSIPKVDKIVGPGNRYVTEAKRQVFGLVGIDSLAGPSEVVVWADSSSDFVKVSLNLLAQSEHDPAAVSYLVCTEKKVSQNIMNLIQDFLRKKPVGFKPNIKVIICRNQEMVVTLINKIAPEHLYLAIRNAKSAVSKIKNAGAIFVGENTPVPLGDYAAGPSHVLPTGRTAAFSSGLSVKDFLKWSSVIEAKSKKSEKAFCAAQRLADVEGLYYHSLSLALK